MFTLRSLYIVLGTDILKFVELLEGSKVAGL